MNHTRTIAGSVPLTLLVLSACGPAGPTCGPGTAEVDGRCVPTTDGGVDDGGPGDGGPGDGSVGYPDSAVLVFEDVHPLDGIGAEGTDASWAALDAVVDGAEIVAFGTPIFSSGGYDLAAQRLFRYLVEQRGFRALAVQAPWDQWDEVVAEACAVDPERALLEAPFGFLASEEMGAILTFACTWNEAHPDDQVAMFGFDPQQPFRDGPAIREFLETVAGGEATSLSTGFETCIGVTLSRAEYFAMRSVRMLAEDHTACLAGLDAIDVWLAANEASALAASSADEVATVRIRLGTVRETELMMWYADYPGISRDEPNGFESGAAYSRGLASTLLGLRGLRAPGQRTLAMTHVAHILKHPEDAEPALPPNVGNLVLAEIGDGYVAIGGAAYEQGTDWPGVTTGFSPPFDGENNVERRLHQLGNPVALLNLHPGDVTTRLVQEGELLDYAGAPDPLDLGRHLDALIYLERSEPIHALLW